MPLNFVPHPAGAAAVAWGEGLVDEDDEDEELDVEVSDGVLEELLDDDELGAGLVDELLAGATDGALAEPQAARPTAAVALNETTATRARVVRMVFPFKGRCCGSDGPHRRLVPSKHTFSTPIPADR